MAVYTFAVEVEVTTGGVSDGVKTKHMLQVQAEAEALDEAIMTARRSTRWQGEGLMTAVRVIDLVEKRDN